MNQRITIEEVARLAGVSTATVSRFPRPDEVLSAFTFIQNEGYGNGKLHQHVLHSLKLVAMGFAVAVSFGVPLGLLMGYSRRAEALINPAFLLLRPIPPLAWIPLAIVWLGLEDGSKILVIFVAAFVPSVINSYTGVRNIDTPVMEAASMLGIKGWRMVAEVLVPLFGFTDRLHIKNFFDFSWPTGHDYDAICQIDCFFYSVGNKEDSAWVFTS